MCRLVFFALGQVCEEYLAKGKDVFKAFMDLEMVYDRDIVGGNLLNTVQSFYVGSRL